MALQLLDARTDTGDYTFLDLSRAAFDLSDRGVEGRPAPLPLDVFMTPERGIYRPGETMHLTALVRDPRANAVAALPMTLVIERPDGVEFQRKTLADAGLGGYSADVAFGDNAMRGSWTAKLFADPKGAAAHVKSTLKPDGSWMIVEPYAEDATEANHNPVGRVFYSASTLVCTPASRSQEVGLALGAQAGESRMRDVILSGGFTQFRRASQTPFNLVFEARP